jgi:hypothetical protein
MRHVSLDVQQFERLTGVLSARSCLLHGIVFVLQWVLRECRFPINRLFWPVRFYNWLPTIMFLIKYKVNAVEFRFLIAARGLMHNQYFP